MADMSEPSTATPRDGNRTGPLPWKTWTSYVPVIPGLRPSPPKIGAQARPAASATVGVDSPDPARVTSDILPTAGSASLQAGTLRPVPPSMFLASQSKILDMQKRWAEQTRQNELVEQAVAAAAVRMEEEEEAEEDEKAEADEDNWGDGESSRDFTPDVPGVMQGRNDSFEAPKLGISITPSGAAVLVGQSTSISRSLPTMMVDLHSKKRRAEVDLPSSLRNHKRLPGHDYAVGRSSSNGPPSFHKSGAEHLAGVNSSSKEDELLLVLEDVSSKLRKSESPADTSSSEQHLGMHPEVRPIQQHAPQENTQEEPIEIDDDDSVTTASEADLDDRVIPDTLEDEENDHTVSENSEDLALDIVSGRGRGTQQELDSSTDEDDDGDIPASLTTAMPQTRHQSNGDGYHEITVAADGRPYSMYRSPSGSLVLSAGAVIPAGYALHDDDHFPYICPIRQCRNLLRSLAALGAHQKAAHKRKALNDNGDGTLTIVDELPNTIGSKSRSIVVSRDPDLAGDPAVTPSLPRVMAMKVAQEAQKRENAIASRRPLDGAPGGYSARRAKVEATNAIARTGRLRRDGTNTPPRAGGARSVTAGIKAGDLASYVRQHVSPAYVFPDTYHSKSLLRFPRLRNLPQTWLDRFRGSQPSLGGLTGILIYLVGSLPADGPCKGCRESPRPYDRCIVLGPKVADEAGKDFRGSCATCLFNASIDHSRNTCSLIGNPRPVYHRGGEQRLQMPAAAAKEDSSGGGSKLEDKEDANRLVARKPRGSAAASALPTPVGSFSRRTSLRRGASVGDGPASDGFVSGGQLVPDALEMEEWEVAPGYISDKADPEANSVAYSNAFLTISKPVAIAEDLQFNVIIIKPGHSHRWEAQAEQLRVCSLAQGKLRVTLPTEALKNEFAIGPNGVFKIGPGRIARVENRLYVDAVLHVSSMRIH